MMTVPKAATRRGCSVQILYNYIHEGKLPATTMLGRIGVKWSDVEALELAPSGEREGVKKKRGPGRPRRTNPENN